MELITPELEKELRAANKGSGSEKIRAKLFNPVGAATWLLTSMDADGDTLWCVADLGLGFVEYGTVSLNELKNLVLPLGMSIERDLYFDPEGLEVSHFLGMDRINMSEAREHAGLTHG